MTRVCDNIYYEQMSTRDLPFSRVLATAICRLRGCEYHTSIVKRIRVIEESRL